MNTALQPHPHLMASNAPETLDTAYDAVRRFTARLCAPLETEDMVIQSMPEASPTRWHLAHTTWFFETFVLKEFVEDYVAANAAFEYLFNSYYNAVGNPFPRAHRGHLSRPTVGEVFRYRRRVDDAVHQLIERANESDFDRLSSLIAIGIHHEQQHQELMLTDIKHVFGCNPLFPPYRDPAARQSFEPSTSRWHGFVGGLVSIGHDGAGFSYDNEGPRHQVFLRPFDLDSRLVTCGDYLAFIADGGYSNSALWLSEGWSRVQEHQWEAPLYWQQTDGVWEQYTLAGLEPVDPTEPVCHVSYFEADAFARWAGARLPLEAEWEIATQQAQRDGNFAESGEFHPRGCSDGADELRQMFGDVWEWTASPYTPYPGYQPAPGALGEYNGKFMCNQYVLRGGSCATPQSHIRATYRNFFPPHARWQFSGIRLARDAA